MYIYKKKTHLQSLMNKCFTSARGSSLSLVSASPTRETSICGEFSRQLPRGEGGLGEGWEDENVDWYYKDVNCYFWPNYSPNQGERL